MHIVVIIILGVILFYSIKTTKSILHPASITSCLWLVLVSVYSFIDHGLYSLSDKFYIALLLWTVPLCLISLFAYKYKYSLPKAISRPYPNNSIRIIYPIMIVCVVFATYGLYLKGLHYNSSNFFAGIRALSVATLNGEEDTFQAPLYIKISTILAQYSLIVLLSIWHKKKNYMPYIFFVVVVFAFFLFRSNKTVIAQLMLALLCFYMFYNKLSKKVLLLFLSLLVVLIFASHLLRSDNSTSFDIIDFLSVYLLSPLPAFDSVLNSTANYIYSFNGEFTFRFLIPFFQTIGFDVIENPDAFNIHNWTYTPVPVNVYTIMFGFYVDFGYSGIFIFSCVLGLLFGVIYKLSIQGYTICRIWYSITFYILVFQFFSDNLFLFLESHIGKFLFSILIFVSINNKNGRHINNHSQL